MSEVAVCARGVKALAFLTAFLDSRPDTDLSVYIDGEENVRVDYLGDLADLCRRHSVECSTAKPPHFESDTLVVSVGWRFMLHAENLVVLHDSLLPKYRGFNPLVTALLAGDREIGVTMIRGVDRVDAGPILSQKRVDIDYPVKLQEAFDLITPLYAELASELSQHLSGSMQFDEHGQDDSFASYSLWRDTDDYRIDWNDSAKNIRRFIDAVGSPYAGARSAMNGESVTINSAMELEDLRIANRLSGKVFAIEDGRPVVVCGDGLLRIDDLCDDAGCSCLPFAKLKTRFS